MNSFSKNLILRSVLVIFFASAMGCEKMTPQEVVIRLNQQQKYQIMTGWEATADLGGHHSIAFKHFREKILNDAINDLGINRIRLEIRSGIENPTDYYAKWQAGEITEKEFEQKRYENINDDSNPKQINPEGFKWTQFDDVVENVVLPLRKISQARGEVLQVNVNYVDFDPSTSLHRNNPEEYAELVLATYQHLQSKYGFVPDSWEVILEPDNGSWSAEQVAAAIKSAGEVLIANNFKPNFIAPSTMNAEVTLAYIDRIAETPKIMEYISEFSYHRYSGVSDEVLQAIAERAKKYGKKTAMLELIGADYNVLHQDLKLANNSSWQQYTLVYHNQPDNGAQYFLLNDKNPQNPTFEIASRTKFLRQYFRNVRFGAQRIGAETSNKYFDPLAFINTDGRYVLVLKSSLGGTISIEGLPPGVYGIYYTTDKETNLNIPDIRLNQGETLKTNIPNKGVITVFAKN